MVIVEILEMITMVPQQKEQIETLLEMIMKKEG